MAAPILTISSHAEDCRLGKVLALNNSIQYLEATNPSEIQRILEKNKGTLVLLDFDGFQENYEVLDLISKYVRPSLCFAVTNGSISTYPHLTRFPFFGTHLQRRFSEPAPGFYSRLLGSHAQGPLEGLKPYFAHDTKIHRIEIKQSAHKKIAIEALQKTLTNRGIKGRLATLVAQSADELILNAIFDAPLQLPEKIRTRHKESRDLEFEMTPQEAVTVEMAASDHYMGICVIDQFGTLEPQTVFRALRPYLSEEPIATDPFSGPSSGFGLSGILQAGLNLKIACKPGKRTETLIVFPIIENFREFRTAFRFFSVIQEGN